MKFDIFLSICQTEVDGHMPSEKQMFANFFEQALLADDLGMGTAWVAETHLSCEIQKQTPEAVIPHFKGEIGLNTDILQVAHLLFSKTKQINVGSAIRNILCNGGPIAHAEAIKTFLILHAMHHSQDRRLNIGFASGRFPFSNVPYGIVPRDAVEEAAWPAMRGLIFQQATEIFLRLLKGEVISSEDVKQTVLNRACFRTDDDWVKVQKAFGQPAAEIPIAPRWVFPKVGVIPFEAPLDYLDLTIGCHDAPGQDWANQFYPCGVFNLSITPPEVIEATHQRMAGTYHPDGGPWRRDLMPRTVLVFIDKDDSQKARQAAIKANENYWRAVEGTLDPKKVERAVDNALVGTPDEVATQIESRFHQDDRLMLWFDFNNHHSPDVMKGMSTFMEEVAPRFSS